MRLIGTRLSTIDHITAQRRNIVILARFGLFMNKRAHELLAIISYGRTITRRDKRLLKINLSESSFCDTSSAILSRPTERETRLSCTPLFLVYRQQFNTRCKARFLEKCNFINDMKFPMLRYRKLTADWRTIIHVPSFLHQRRRYRGYISGIESPQFAAADSRLNQRIIVDTRESRRSLSDLRIAFSDCNSRIKRTRVK